MLSAVSYAGLEVSPGGFFQEGIVAIVPNVYPSGYGLLKGKVVSYLYNRESISLNINADVVKQGVRSGIGTQFDPVVANTFLKLTIAEPHMNSSVYLVTFSYP